MASGGMSLEQQFVNFSKFGDPKADGKSITLTQSDKWMKQAEILDGKQFTLTDTGVCFNKYKSKSIDCKTFIKFIEDLANSKNLNPQDLKDKLADCGLPGTTTTKSTKAKHK